MLPTIYVARSGEITPARARMRRDSRRMDIKTTFRCFYPGPKPCQQLLSSAITWTTCLSFLRVVEPGTSPASPGTLCDSQPVQQLACYAQAQQGGEFTGTRSRHPGGVNSLFGDGSVRFMKNSINPMTWVALGSINAGEVISSDSY